MGDHSLNFFQEYFQQESDPTMLHHATSCSATVNGGNHQPTIQAAPLFSSSMDQFTNSGGGGGSTKIQSCPSLSPQEESTSKRATFPPPSSSTSATNSTSDVSIPGFTKLPLRSPVLRRTTSAPINSPLHKNPTSDQASVDAAGNFWDPHLPPVTSTVNSAASSPSAPLHRTVSDPTPVFHPLAVATTSSPSRLPPAVRKLMPPSPSNGLRETPPNTTAESPVTKKLSRIMDRLRDMNQRWNEIIKEGEDDIGFEDNDNLPKVDESEPVSQETEAEEAVWVETKGECLILHFKCPCTKGYQILLCGNSCYYKLN